VPIIKPPQKKNKTNGIIIHTDNITETTKDVGIPSDSADK
jgi:hypothetical protein